MSNVSLYYPPQTQRQVEEIAPLFKGNKSAVFQAAIALLHTQVTDAARSSQPMPVTIEA
jgi:hypothetical protein